MTSAPFAPATASVPYPTRADDPKIRSALRGLELTVRRRLDGLLQGDHLGLLPGPGSEAGETRAYLPGDDVRRMDWGVTARTGTAAVRETIADRELETWLAIDLSASLLPGSAPSGMTKRDLAINAAAAVAILTEGTGNRVGAFVSTGEQTRRLPLGASAEHARALVRELMTAAPARPGEGDDLRALLTAIRRVPMRRGLLVLISDFLGPVDWARELRALGARQELVAVEVLDPLDLALPDAGEVTLTDPETGAVGEYRLTRELRGAYAQAAQAHRREVDDALRSARADVVRLRTDEDWVIALARFARRRSRGGGRVRG